MKATPHSGGHAPVMLREVLGALGPLDNETYIDGTFGGGGYTQAILATARCSVLAIDRDEAAIARAKEMARDLAGEIANASSRLTPILGVFGEMASLARNAGYDSVDGVVLDIGVSSFQIDQAARGFSFMRDGPLDMRMGGDGPTAADVVNFMSEGDLANVIFRLGEEKQSRRIARAIVGRRETQDFGTTLDLAETIETAVGGRKGGRIHPATRTFQAIRMYVNDELGELARALHAAERILSPGGRLVVVAFHSLEDRMVKQWLRRRAGKAGGGSRHVPVGEAGPAPTFDMLNNKALAPSEEECAVNPRARSAKLRAAIRTEAAPMGGEPSDGMNLPPLSALEVAA